MKKNFVSTVSAILIIMSFSYCHSNSSDTGGDRDTAMRTSADTAVISGTPGPSGSQPRPIDTAQSHRDSLKHTHNLIDSAK